VNVHQLPRYCPTCELGRDPFQPQGVDTLQLASTVHRTVLGARQRLNDRQRVPEFQLGGLKLAQGSECRADFAERKGGVVTGLRVLRIGVKQRP